MTRSHAAESSYSLRPLLPVYSESIVLRESTGTYVMSHMPWAMFALSFLQCFLFLWYVPQSDQLLLDISNSIWPYTAPKSLELWRLVGYSFIHVEFQHLICNVSVEIALGVYLEKFFGRLHTVCIFALGAVTGALVVGLFNDNDILIGASAGVCALLASLAARQFANLLCCNYTICTVWWIVVFLLTVSMDIGSLICDVKTVNKERSHLVAYFSHLGGSVAGFIYGVLYLSNPRGSQFRLVVWWSAALSYVFAVSLSVVLIADKHS